MAHAVGMAASMLPPTKSQAARQSAGLTLLPPASREYLHQDVGEELIRRLSLIVSDL